MYGYGFLSRCFTDRYVKFCMAVRPDLRQVFSHFGVDSPRDGQVTGVSRGHMADMLLAEALVNHTIDKVLLLQFYSRNITQTPQSKIKKANKRNLQ